MSQPKRITITLDGNQRDVLARRMNEDSNAYELLDLDGRPTDMFLKDVSETGSAHQREFSLGEDVLNRPLAPGESHDNFAHQQALLLKHHTTKLQFIKRLGILSEPYLGNYVDSVGRCFIITRKVGRSLQDILKEPSPTLGLKTFQVSEQILRILATLHGQGFSHNHAHMGNFSLVDGKVFVIDLVRSRRKSSIQWKDPGAVYEEFSADYSDAQGLLEALFFRVRDSKVPSEFRIFDFFVRLIHSYPMSIPHKYRVLFSVLPEVFTHGGHIVIPESIDVELIYSDRQFLELRNIISQWKKEDHTFFPGVWRTHQAA